MKIIMKMILISILTISAWGQVEIRPDLFYVDYASFASDSADCDLLEVYYQIYTSKLSFVLKDGKYFASYSVSAVIKKNKKQVNAVETDGYFFVDTYAETEDIKRAYINVLRFYVKPGKYQLVTTLNDLNASSSLPLEKDIIVSDYDNDKLLFSDIEFVREQSPAEEPSVFNKIGYRIIPTCSRKYGDGLNQLRFYFEYYGKSDNGDTVQFDYQVVNKKNNVLVEKTVYEELTSTGYIDSLDLDYLSPGVYDLVISIPSDEKKRKIQTIRQFYLYWSVLELVRNDFESAVEQLYYIASTEQMNTLRDSPDEQRIKQWNDFWKSKDPSPGTDENEIMDEYYRRIAFTNRDFSIPYKAGWRTDMGMIYIIHGEPDEIERHPFDMGNKPYEIWYFYNPRRRFLFIDEKGYGEFKLQYPLDGDVNKQIDIYGGSP